MISASRYKIIADYVNNSQARGFNISSHLNDMSSTLSNSSILPTSTDGQRLLDQIDTTSDLLISRHQYYTKYVIKFVLVLQQYINENYSSVNDFLFNNSIKVLPVFADISEQVGYPIEASNIENIS